MTGAGTAQPTTPAAEANTQTNEAPPQTPPAAAAPTTEIKGVRTPDVTAEATEPTAAPDDDAEGDVVDEVDLRHQGTVPADAETAAAVADAEAHLARTSPHELATPEEINSTFVSSQPLTQLQTQYSHRTPSDEMLRTMDRIRQDSFDLALLISTTVPEGRERALALTKLEEARMWANSGLTMTGSPRKLPEVRKASLTI